MQLTFGFVSDEDVERMIARGRLIRCLWVYAPESELCSAMQGLMWELQRKVRQFHQSAETFWLHNRTIVNRNLVEFSSWKPPMPLPWFFLEVLGNWVLHTSSFIYLAVSFINACLAPQIHRLQNKFLIFFREFNLYIMYRRPRLYDREKLLMITLVSVFYDHTGYCIFK